MPADAVGGFPMEARRTRDGAPTPWHEKSFIGMLGDRHGHHPDVVGRHWKPCASALRLGPSETVQARKGVPVCP